MHVILNCFQKTSDTCRVPQRSLRFYISRPWITYEICISPFILLFYWKCWKKGLSCDRSCIYLIISDIDFLWFLLIKTQNAVVSVGWNIHILNIQRRNVKTCSLDVVHLEMWYLTLHGEELFPFHQPWMCLLPTRLSHLSNKHALSHLLFIIDYFIHWIYIESY